MIVRKVTYGCVVQTIDTEKNEFLDQEFIAGDECQYEDEHGPIDISDIWDGENKIEPYLNYDMVQPESEATDAELEDWAEGERGA